ncbi:MAG: hypothetical protein IIC01_02170, partial [Planctomycetes bacterium]|nr:hypothetical protein [Planctomycetota bacterium]
MTSPRGEVAVVIPNAPGFHQPTHPPKPGSCRLGRVSFAMGFILAGLMAFSSVASVRAQLVLYVDANAPGLNDGSSWEDAYQDLQAAL